MLNNPLKELSAALAQKKISSAELTKLFLDRISRLNAALNAFITVDAEKSLAQARAADERIAKGAAQPLTGIPVAHKDIFVTKGWRTTCGSKMLENFVSPYDAHVIERFNASAAALAARMAPAATGTDTGGSIRQPAALSGLSGLKPTYGLVSRYGMIAFASSLDQGGPMAKSAEDLALLLNVMAGFDARDSTSIERAPEDYSRDLDKPLSGLRIGVPKEHFGEGLSADVGKSVETALKELEKLGAKRVSISLPNSRLSMPAYYVIAPAEASSNLSRFDGVRYGYRASGYRDLADMYRKTRAEGFGAEVKRRILIGTYVLSHGYYDAYYLKAQKIRRLIAQDFIEAFKQCDVIVGPTSPTVAFRIGAKAADPVQMYLNDIYTIPANLAGLPGMSIACGFGANALPVGLHIVGDYFSEAKMLNVAHQYQRVTDWHRREPAGIRQ